MTAEMPQPTGVILRIGLLLSYSSNDFQQTVAELTEFERAGLDMVRLPEAYSFDAVSQLGFIAARTRTLKLYTGILNVYSRTPALIAMTAAGLDAVSEGRFMLGLGASGPQVIEGFHGMPYTAPLGRTREVVEICRAVWRREPVTYDGVQFQLPLSEQRGGTGFGKPLKLINRPVRPRIPIVLAALGPKNVTLAAELFEGWEPIFYYPEQAAAAFGDALAAGRAKRDADLGPLEIIAGGTFLAITDDPDAEAAALQTVRERLALYVGGMGARGKNFYNELARRYGFGDAAATVQDLYLAGQKAQAAAALPDALVRGISLIGAPGAVQERLAAFAAADVTAVNVTPLAPTHPERVRDIARLRELSA
jgi:F420-dependent oxidoreductase-like protein